MYLIDNTYFVNKYQIDGILESNNGVSQKLNDYIENFVIDFLQTLLGAVNFTELDSFITDGVLDDNAPQEWKDLVNGKTYQKNGKTYVWKGLVYLKGSQKRSLLTNYIFCKIIADIETNNGLATISTKNAVKGVPRSHFVNVWNELCEQVGVMPIEHRRYTLTYHFGVPVYDYFVKGCNENGYVTLFQYLKDFDFEGVNYGFLEFMNRLDIG